MKDEIKVNPILNLIRKFKDKIGRKKFIIIIICLSILVIILILIKFVFTPINIFEYKLKTNNISGLQESYENIEQYEQKKKADIMLKQIVDDLILEYTDQKLSYDAAELKLKKYNEVKVMDKYLSDGQNKLSSMKESKESFDLGIQQESANNFIESINYYEKVIELDKDNFKIAQTKLSELKVKLKDDTMLFVDQKIKEGKFVDAQTRLKQANSILKDDNDIKVKSDAIKIKVKDQQTEEYKNTQEVTVESAKATKTGYFIDFYYADVRIKNNTNKVIKSYSVEILGYDKNNFPVQINYSSFKLTGKNDGVNIQPNTVGQTASWSLMYEEDKISKIIACVVEVEYYDGTKWENPYLEYWEDKYLEKEFKE